MQVVAVHAVLCHRPCRRRAVARNQGRRLLIASVVASGGKGAGAFCVRASRASLGLVPDLVRTARLAAPSSPRSLHLRPVLATVESQGAGTAPPPPAPPIAIAPPAPATGVEPPSPARRIGTARATAAGRRTAAASSGWRAAGPGNRDSASHHAPPFPPAAVALPEPPDEALPLPPVFVGVPAPALSEFPQACRPTASANARHGSRRDRQSFHERAPVPGF